MADVQAKNIKSKVYTTPPANLDDLEMRIRNEMVFLGRTELWFDELLIA